MGLSVHLTQGSSATKLQRLPALAGWGRLRSFLSPGPSIDEVRARL